MKILFLDVDGVLNMHGSGGFLALNKNRIRLLREIVEATDCKIVVSSTWRKLPDTRSKLRKHLRYKGMSIYDWTTTEYFKERQIRGDEIQKWLDENDYWTSYCIVDDDADMLETQLANFYRTDGKMGLTKDAVRVIVGILNNDEKVCGPR